MPGPSIEQGIRSSRTEAPTLRASWELRMPANIIRNSLRSSNTHPSRIAPRGGKARPNAAVMAASCNDDGWEHAPPAPDRRHAGTPAAADGDAARPPARRPLRRRLHLRRHACPLYPLHAGLQRPGAELRGRGRAVGSRSHTEPPGSARRSRSPGPGAPLWCTPRPLAPPPLSLALPPTSCSPPAAGSPCRL